MQFIYKIPGHILCLLAGLCLSFGWVFIKTADFLSEFNLFPSKFAEILSFGEKIVEFSGKNLELSWFLEFFAAWVLDQIVKKKPWLRGSEIIWKLRSPISLCFDYPCGPRSWRKTRFDYTTVNLCWFPSRERFWTVLCVYWDVGCEAGCIAKLTSSTFP